MEEHMKAIYGVVLAILLGSCSPFGLNPMGYEVLHEDLDVAWKKVSSMKYMDDGGSDGIKSPVEFFRDGGGDCLDFAGTLIYLLGPDAELVETLNNDGVKHALVRWDGLYIEPQVYGIYEQESSLQILEGFSYNNVLELSTNYGRKSL
jgi:hypothetical protein